MKKLEMIVRPSVVQQVIDALEAAGVGGMTVTPVDGCGNQKGQTGLYRGTEFSVRLRAKVKVEVVVEDEAVDRVIQRVCAASRPERSVTEISLSCPSRTPCGFAPGKRGKALSEALSRMQALFFGWRSDMG